MSGQPDEQGWSVVATEPGSGGVPEGYVADEQGRPICHWHGTNARVEQAKLVASHNAHLPISPSARPAEGATPSAPTGDHGGLREAVEALAEHWERESDAFAPTDGVATTTFKSAAALLRAALAAHPEPEPAQDGEVGA